MYHFLRILCIFTQNYYIMKKHCVSILSAALAVSFSLTGCALLGGGQWDAEYLAGAASNAITAATLSNAQVIELSRESVAYMDKENKVNTGSYKKRLDNLMKGIDQVDGLTLNFKVYETSEINAFACGDGSIRVYSGLMDVMNDDQLIAIIGHEIGHVVHKDTKAAMQRSYAALAARGVVAASGGVAGAVAASSIGGLAQSFMSAQFSQKQEFAADEYGFKFSVEHGHSPYSMATALEKLVELNNSSSQASAVAKMFASHPDSALRAQKMRAKADAMKK